MCRIEYLPAHVDIHTSDELVKLPAVGLLVASLGLVSAGLGSMVESRVCR